MTSNYDVDSPPAVLSENNRPVVNFKAFFGFNILKSNVWLFDLVIFEKLLAVNV